MILLCPQHHKVIDDQPQIYTADLLVELKAIHESVVGRKSYPEDDFYAQLLLNAYRNVEIVNNSGNIAINSPGSIQGTNVTVKARGSNVKIQPALGSLGADPVLSKYVAHLIIRYNEFASKGSNTKTKFCFGAISKNIESKFGTRWQLLGMEYSHDVIEYLQFRINRTKQARINKGSAHPAFSSLDEYVKKYGKGRI